MIPLSIQAEEFTRQQLVFGNVLATITIDANVGEEQAYRIMQKAWKIVADVDERFSLYIADSELNRLRTSEGIRLSLSKTMHSVLQSSLELCRITEGYFNPLYENHIRDCSQVKIRDRRLHLAIAQQLINPTGLLKGYTVGQMIATLKRDRSVQSAYVALGGDVGFFSRSNKSRRVYVVDPKRRNPSKQFVELRDQFVSTSGLYERGRHIVNTGGQDAPHLQVSVVSDSGAVSDALSTGMLHMPLDKIRKTIQNFRNVTVIVMDRNGVWHYL